MVGPGVGQDCMVGPGVGWDCMVGPGVGWDCMVGPGVGWDCMVGPGVGWGRWQQWWWTSHRSFSFLWSLDPDRLNWSKTGQ